MQRGDGISPLQSWPSLCTAGQIRVTRMTNLVFRFATVQGQHVHWLLRRNCSVTPRQLVLTYLSLCAVSIGIGTFFWFQGATLVMPFASLELLAVGGAFLVYARHSTDGERIFLRENQLVVELECAGKLERAEFQRGWVRVEPRADDSSLIELSERGRTIRVGRYIRPELRPQLAREIRSALRAV
jgi:uncharacterized membrane protein